MAPGSDAGEEGCPAAPPCSCLHVGGTAGAVTGVGAALGCGLWGALGWQALRCGVKSRAPGPTLSLIPWVSELSGTTVSPPASSTWPPTSTAGRTVARLQVPCRPCPFPVQTPQASDFSHLQTGPIITPPCQPPGRIYKLKLANDRLEGRTCVSSSRFFCRGGAGPPGGCVSPSHLPQRAWHIVGALTYVWKGRAASHFWSESLLGQTH